MAPTRPKGGSSKGSNKRGSKSSKSSNPRQSAARGRDAAGPTVSKSKSKAKVTKKPAPIKPKQKKRRVYTEAELDIPKLNMITPAGVRKPKGQKKGKVFVDDQEQMMTILAMVNADKDGQIESKMMRARQLEEIRQARIAETEARAESKKQKLEDTKNELRRQKRGTRPAVAPTASNQASEGAKKPATKRVSFG